MINDLRVLLERWDYLKGFYGYARVLGLQRAALRAIEGRDQRF